MGVGGVREGVPAPDAHVQRAVDDRAEDVAARQSSSSRVAR